MSTNPDSSNPVVRPQQSASEISPYVAVPRAVFDERYGNSIAREQWEILQYGYYKADRSDFYRVQSYSAGAVCLFLGLPVTTANLKRYERAAVGLWKRCLVARNYVHLPKGTRTYSLWLLPPSAWEQIGTPDENRELWPPVLHRWLYNEKAAAAKRKANATLPLSNRTVSVSPTPTLSESQETEVPTDQGHIRDGSPAVSEWASPTYMITNHSEEEREPLNPLRGLLPPAPQGGRSPLRPAQTPLGLKDARMNTTLSRERYSKLTEAATLYANLSHDLHDKSFVPDVTAVEALLRFFTPRELLCAEFTKFGWNVKGQHKEMAHFFAHGAKTLITAARFARTSTKMPDEFLGNATWKTSKFLDDWRRLNEVYREVFPEDASAAQPEPAVAAA